MGLVRALPGAEPPHRRDVLRRMQPAQFLLPRRPRRHQPGILVVKGPIAPQQLVGIAQPHRAHRVAAPQFVARHPVIINKSGPGHIIPPAEKCRRKCRSKASADNPAPGTRRRTRQIPRNLYPKTRRNPGPSGYISGRCGKGRCALLSAPTGGHRAESPDFGPACPISPYGPGPQ